VTEGFLELLFVSFPVDYLINLVLVAKRFMHALTQKQCASAASQTL